MSVKHVHCTRTNIEKRLTLESFKLKKVIKLNFLEVMIDDNHTWEAQIDYLKENIVPGIVIIKRINKFIPVSIQIPSQLLY